MATPELKTGDIYKMIHSLREGNINDFTFAKIKREIDKIRPHDAVAADDLMATLYSFYENYAKAFDYHKKAITKEPGLSIIRHNYGVTLRKAGMPVQAQDQFLQALPYSANAKERFDSLSKAIMVSMELFDMHTYYELTEQNENILSYAVMPKEIQTKADELKRLMQKTGTSKEALKLFSVRIMEFFKRYHVEPVNSHVTEDPEGGLFFSYTLAMTQDEMLALDEHYIDFLMEKDASVMDVGAVFWCA